MGRQDERIVQVREMLAKADGPLRVKDFLDLPAFSGLSGINNRRTAVSRALISLEATGEVVAQRHKRKIFATLFWAPHLPDRPPSAAPSSPSTGPASSTTVLSCTKVQVPPPQPTPSPDAWTAHAFAYWLAAGEGKWPAWAEPDRVRLLEKARNA